MTTDTMDLSAVLESLFDADGRWVLIDPKTLEAVGPFSSEEEADTFRISYLNNYKTRELKDPEDVFLQHHHGQQ